SPGGILPASMMDHVFHNIFLEGMVHGKFIFPIGNGGYPLGKGPYCDFMGVNYYSRDIIRFSYNPLRLFGELTVKEDTEVNDLGWEIYPKDCTVYVKKSTKRILSLFTLQRMELAILKMNNGVNLSLTISKLLNNSLMKGYRWKDTTIGR